MWNILVSLAAAPPSPPPPPPPEMLFSSIGKNPSSLNSGYLRLRTRRARNIAPSAIAMDPATPTEIPAICAVPRVIGVDVVVPDVWGVDVADVLKDEVVDVVKADGAVVKGPELVKRTVDVVILPTLDVMMSDELGVVVGGATMTIPVPVDGMTRVAERVGWVLGNALA
jgi:hypothetical protein